MNLLGDILAYIRRIVKTPSGNVLTDGLIIDYINRFYIMDMDARIQLFDFKTKYQFQTSPGVDQYNMPLYSVQEETVPPNQQLIGMYPVYQGFMDPCYVQGVRVPFHTLKSSFFNIFPKVVQQMQVVAIGDGSPGPYKLQFPVGLGPINPPFPLNPPVSAILRGHVDMSGIIAINSVIDPIVVSSAQASLSIPGVPVTSVDSAVFITSTDATGANVVVQDSGQFLDGAVNYGLLMEPGPAPKGNLVLPGGYSTTSNTVNYFTGIANVEFPVAIPVGVNINVQCYYFQSGLPRAILYNNNCITLRMPPSSQCLVELDAYLSPAAFLQGSGAIPFGYMAEYIARGAARKILSDTGDVEQFQFYEPLFKEQEILVWKRSQRQFTSTRTPTIYSQGLCGGQGIGYGGGYGGGNSI